MASSSLSLSAVCGFDREGVQNLHNLTDTERNAIIYVASNTVIYHDIDSSKQNVMQGHCNKISALRVSGDKRYAVTADVGPEPMIVVWDTYAMVPVRTYFSPFPDKVGVSTVDMSVNGEYIVALSDSSPQYMVIYRWEEDGPIAMAQLAMDERQKFVTFHRYDYRQIMTNGSGQAVFWQMLDNDDPDTMDQVPYCFDYHAPEIPELGSHKLTMSTFLATDDPKAHLQAVTATTGGALIHWLGAGDELVDITVNKVVPLHDRAPRAINAVHAGEGWMATAGADGCVRVFDFAFKIVSWYEGLNAGPVTSISFARLGGIDNEDNDDVLQGTAIRLPDFVIGTSAANIVAVDLAEVDGSDDAGAGVNTIVRGFSAPITCMAPRPDAYEAYVGTEDGHLHIVDLQDRSIIKTHRFQVSVASTDVAKSATYQHLPPRAVAVHPNGEFVAVGLGDGALALVHTDTLSELSTFTHSPSPILKVLFSPDGSVLATTDESFCVSLYRADTGRPRPTLDDNGRMPSLSHWCFVGKCRAHRQPVVDACFLPPATDEEMVLFKHAEQPGLRLASIGEDRKLSVVDVDRSTVHGGLLLTTHMDAEDTGTPAFISYIPINDKAYRMTPDGPRLTQVLGNTVPVAVDNRAAVLIGTRDHKLRLRDAVTFELLRTVTGPTYGFSATGFTEITAESAPEETIEHPGVALPDIGLSLPTETHGCRHYLYTTPQKVLGLYRSPFDGNPVRSLGMIAHSGALVGAGLTFDSQYVIAAGATDGALTVWRVDLPAFDATIDSAGRGVEPFIDQLEGGREGDFFADLQDFFVYSQLRSQGENNTHPRRPSGRVAVPAIADLFRALGFYPSEADLKALTDEIGTHTARLCQAAGRPTVPPTLAEVDLDTFIRLFVNHRPLTGIELSDIIEAFSALGAEPLTGLLDRGLLADHLAAGGDKMTDEELAKCVAVLMGDAVGEGEAGEYLQQVLGDQVAAGRFAGEVLGFDGPDGLVE